MLPNFYSWLEQTDVEGSPSGVSEPQHKAGENNLPLNKLVEKRIKEMIEEFTSKGTATEDEIISSINSYLNKNSKTQNIDQNQPADTLGLDQNQQPPSNQNPNMLGQI